MGKVYGLTVGNDAIFELLLPSAVRGNQHAFKLIEVPLQDRIETDPSQA